MTSCRHSACVPAQRLCRMRTIVKEIQRRSSSKPRRSIILINITPFHNYHNLVQQDVQHQDGEDDCYCLQHATRHLNSAELSTHSQMYLPFSFGIYLHYQPNIHCPLIVILLTSSQSNTSTLISCQNGKQNQQALKITSDAFFKQTISFLLKEVKLTDNCKSSASAGRLQIKQKRNQ
ncbi:conserved hypothetical protein [Trichinella spiralis]|uniref:hypothetical protein n=1 Tax=Trichinella spiralis TaxID=6334 RepID=UPI0001EFC206|nr:conserved hypothetical protein [Trichinella spiralis]